MLLIALSEKGTLVETGPAMIATTFLSFFLQEYPHSLAYSSTTRQFHNTADRFSTSSSDPVLLWRTRAFYQEGCLLTECLLSRFGTVQLLQKREESLTIQTLFGSK